MVETPSVSMSTRMTPIFGVPISATKMRSQSQSVSQGLTEVPTMTAISNVATLVQPELISKTSTQKLKEMGLVEPTMISRYTTAVAVTPDVNTKLASLVAMDMVAIPKLTTILTPERVTPPVEIPPIVPPPVIPLTGGLPDWSLPGDYSAPRRGLRGTTRKIVDPLADWRILFERKFGFMGAPGVTRSVNLYMPEFMSKFDVGDFGAKLKQFSSMDKYIFK